jgi:hypothetical protein
VLDRHDGPLAAPTSFVGVEPASVVLSALKPAGFPLVTDGTPPAAGERRSVVLRLYEAYGEGPSDVRIHFFAPVQQAWLANLLEERGEAVETTGGDLAIKLGPAAVQTLELQPGDIPARLPAASLDTLAEPVQPVPSRYWRGGQLAAPLGNQPVALTLAGQPLIGQTVQARVTVANNTRSRLTGTVWLVAPKVWDVSPQRFDYRLSPFACTTRTVKVSVPTGTRGDLLAALTQVAGQTYRDAVTAGAYAPIAVSVRRSADRLVALIRNPNPFAVAGQAEAVTGIEAWPASLVGPYSRWAVTPRVQAFSVDPNADAEVSFRIEPGAPQAWQEGFWAVVKLAYDGQVAYAAEPPP